MEKHWFQNILSWQTVIQIKGNNSFVIRNHFNSNFLFVMNLVKMSLDVYKRQRLQSVMCDDVFSEALLNVSLCLSAQ